MNAWLKQQWIQLSSPFDPALSGEIFEEIILAYTGKGRYYHTTDHLVHLLQLSRDYSSYLSDKTAIDFAIFFHDIVYNVTRSDNEEKSAVFAEEKLARLGFSREKTELVKNHILATKTHQPNIENNDQLFFLDFDMSILGAEELVYVDYTKRVRQEFSIFPANMYRKGRRQFLENTLATAFIFHTEPFRLRLEERARENLRKELEELFNNS